ncbi:MAG: hypothetical protein Pg6C_17640 [Treponemataceae bacterium]|nr:MAG: hypothetical protein Pg6C_17640 [Treponemataceae bacterium]
MKPWSLLTAKLHDSSPHFPLHYTHLHDYPCRQMRLAGSCGNFRGRAKAKGEADRKMTVKALCGKVEMTRQNYYKERKKKERRLWLRLDGRKVFHMPAPELARHGIKLNRG